MATVVTLANMPSTPTDVAVNFLDQTKLKLRSSTVSTDGLALASDYVYADGDPSSETTVAVRMNIDPKTWIVRHSIRLKTRQTVVVDDIPSEDQPIEVVISWNTPGVPEDSTKVLAMIGTAFSLTFDGVTSKVPNTGIQSEINFGLLGGLYG